MAIRKDANTLTSAERQEFVQAALALKQSGVYNQFVLRHANTPMASIHRGPAFLPWHRRFIFDFERELQRVSGNPNLGLPYWNWPNGGSGASMWDNDLLGGDGNTLTGIVETGPFRSGQWRVINSSGSTTGPLRREFGRNISSLPTLAEIQQVLAVTPYDSFPWNTGSAPSFRNQLEGWRGPNLHNRGHVWVGGSMTPMTSPNDPVFFMHHCMVDKLWHEWQLRFPNQGYLPGTGGPFGQNLTDVMAGTPNSPAAGSRPIDVLDSAALGIEYDQLLPGTPQPGQPGRQVTQLDVNAPAVAGRIAQPGEIDVFEFSLDQRRDIVLETSGSSDTVMTLNGPDDFSREIAMNDDGGSGFNSRIAMTLSAGTYHVSIRLYRSDRTGDYQIRLQSDSGAPAPSIPVLTVNSPPLSAEIGADRESDVYQIDIPTAGRYRIETQGNTDVFLSLYGPGNQTTLIAADDDSGLSLNARLTLTLNPGRYFASVRHFSPLGRGDYRIRIVRQ